MAQFKFEKGGTANDKGVKITRLVSAVPTEIKTIPENVIEIKEQGSNILIEAPNYIRASELQGYNSILFSDVIKDNNTPCVSVADARSYLEDVCFNAESSGGGGNTPSQSTDFSFDKTGALQTSLKNPLFNIKLTQGKRADFWDEEVVGDATSLHDKDGACVNMSVSKATDYVIRQTKMRIPYRPGDPQLVEMTGVFSEGLGISQKIGSFNTDSVAPYNTGEDGLYFEYTDNTAYVCVSNNGVTTRVPQSGWNEDKGDGTGESGITLDFTKNQIYTIQYLWLGVDGATFGVQIAGKFLALHTFDFKNIGTGVFMKTPNHSLRYEIRSTGGAATMKAICSAVFSLNGTNATGRAVAIGRALNDWKDVNAIGAYVPVLVVRLKQQNLDESYLLRRTECFSDTGANAENIVTYNPVPRINNVLSTWDDPALTWQDDLTANTGLEYCIIPQSLNISLDENDLGTIVFRQYVSNNTDIAVNSEEGKLTLGAAINGTRDVIVSAAQTTANEDIFANFNFIEQ